MNLIITGKILSVITLFVLKKLAVVKYFELKIYESIIGWFLIEYTFEAYLETSGSLFFTLCDFRSLILNFVLVFNEIIFNKMLVLFFKYFILILSFAIVCYILTLKNSSLPSKLFLSFYLYHFICYALGLELFWFNLIYLNILIFYFNDSIFLSKLSLYVFLWLIIFICLLKQIISLDFIFNNFLQETFVKLLFVYSYVYYF